MKNPRDVIIIGAGPAGLSAAIAASGYGLDVLVLDEQPSLGGQIYRNIEKAGKERLSILGSDYREGLELAKNFRNSNADYIPNAIVWKIDHKGTLIYSRQGNSTEISAKAIIIATGAVERPVPFTGWSLPGVMGAGAMDANFKSSGTMPVGPVVLAGSGPILLLTAGHLISLGVTISAVLDTTPTGNILSAMPHLPKALKRLTYLLKGVRMLSDLKKSGITWIRDVKQYSAHGTDSLSSVSYRTKKGDGQIQSQVLLSHEGVIPRGDFSTQLRLPHLWDPIQQFWYPQTDIFGKTEKDNIYIAGDGAFVHGCISAGLKGELTAVHIAAYLKVISETQKADVAKNLQKKLLFDLAPRPYIDALYKPRPSLYTIDDDVLVCRCENITAKDIRKTLAEGCTGANEIKAITRCGMGPCQGRMCGATLTEIIADYLHVEPFSIDGLNTRPPVRNISLSELSQVDLLDSEV